MAGDSVGGNHLLDALPAAARRSVAGRGQLVSLSAGQTLFRQGQSLQTVYFPVTAVASLVTTLKDGSAIEVATIGNEGTTGAPVLLGAGAVSNVGCICQISGDAVALAAGEFSREVGDNPPLRDACLRYIAVLLTEIGQGVACSRLHTTTQRCARWLLTVQDRVGSNSLRLTHEFLGLMLGSRRASVTETLGALQSAGLVRATRGRIEILDRGGLEQQSCECYGVIAAAIDELVTGRH